MTAAASLRFVAVLFAGAHASAYDRIMDTAPANSTEIAATLNADITRALGALLPHGALVSTTVEFIGDVSAVTAPATIAAQVDRQTRTMAFLSAEAHGADGRRAAIASAILMLPPRES